MLFDLHVTIKVTFRQDSKAKIGQIELSVLIIKI